ncbi:lipopolysaccharide assembly protein LapB [Thalassotalea sp. HSM 43]|uniref:lipopolysaccharide assembly protein LapB n=1 Tax=Thalassotalea sp. HSM 43 TaxID=2552945 RepID=UPI001080B5AB|nr:lipopolysaccharide assembly protein LapB [Thalassotalea sp. HSM 43]QBY05779.1 lipopolysaccharide assembly protein LapB [Thalassotalea sp. HSM 43]
MFELLFLLLPVAVGYGWFMGRNSVKQKDQTDKDNLTIKYSTGLNYLLSNQQDKAMEFLLEALTVEDDTVEAHFAMANLFRKRGELDRALKVHEYLVRQPVLSDPQKQQALFELGRDFYAAGLFDRAEKLFLKLTKTPTYGNKSLSYLLQIYQNTKDWQKGRELEKAIIKSKDKKLQHVLANFYCELATQAFAQNEYIRELELLQKALELHPKSSRANFLMAQVFENSEQFNDACQCYKEIFYQDMEFFPDVIDKMQAAYQRSDINDEFYPFIRKVFEKSGSTTALIKYLEYVEQSKSKEKAEEYILQALKRRPTIRGFKHFVKMQRHESQDDKTAKSLDVISEMVAAYINIRPRYSCRNCGFNSTVHYWSCPSCHDWEQLKPVRGLEGE